ncbi:putative bifunctional diguanylate cyclase/phosphodiesterase [Ketobacter sp.]|nr:MAG: EAL domain-containing protein [Ketobacter sp.]
MTHIRSNGYSHHLLLVDEKSDLLESLQTEIIDKGYRTISSNNTREALEQLKKSNFDLVIMDLVNPDETGQEIMQFLQEKSDKIPVIVLSKNYRSALVTDALKRNAFYFLRKPNLDRELVSCIQKALEQRRLQHEYDTIEQRIKQAESMREFMVNYSPDLIYVLNEKGYITFVNDQVETLLNISKQDIVGQHFSELMSDEEHRQHPYIFNERRAEQRKNQRKEIRLRKRLSMRSDGKSTSLSMPFEINAVGIYETCLKSGNAEFKGTYGIARDITDRKQAESLMRFQAYHDLLTGLPNRSLFRDRLSLAISHAKRSSSKVAVMFLDLDRFKFINDTLGHNIGDQLLQSVARRISECLREGDTLSRFGGDEFTLLLPNLKSQNDAQIIARKIISELQQPFHIESQELFVSCSTGISVYPDHGEQIDLLIQNADIAMFHTKSRGKNGFQFFTERMNQSYTNSFTIERDLRSCLEQNELYLEYQPIINIETQHVYALEAYLRWQHPTKGVVKPGEFLEIAQETGIIIDMGIWVVNQVCADLEEWANPVLKIAINFSPQQVEHEDFEHCLMSAVKAHNVSPNQIELEITEQLLLRDHSMIKAKLKRLSRLGFSIAVDDFGTGFSSLSNLHLLPINTIKLDPSFLKHIGEEFNSGDACIVNAISAMATGLNLNLVAEGVETEKQRDYLSKLGCNNMQGYLFQEPVSSEEARNILVAPLYKA